MKKKKKIQRKKMLSCQLSNIRRTRFDQSSPVNPVSVFRGGKLSVTKDERKKSLCLILDKLGLLHTQLGIFLDALATLVLMIVTHSLTDTPIDNLQSYATHNGLSLKIECHSKWNVTQNGISLKMECHSKWNVIQNGMSLKMEFHLKWNVTQNGMSLTM